jgi:hypothetical protein
MKPRRHTGPHTAAPLVAALALAVLPGGALSARAQELRMPRVDFAFDKETDFSQLKTFRWKEGASSAPTPEAETRIVWYVERELEKKGLRKSTDGNADVLVRYYAKAEKSLKGTPSQSESYLPGGTGSLTTSVDFSKVMEASLLLELQRSADEKTIWRAASEYRTIDPKRVDAETASAVRRLLAKYPLPRP